MLNLASMDELPGACQPLKFYAKCHGKVHLSMCSGRGPQCSSEFREGRALARHNDELNDSLQMEQGSGAGTGTPLPPPPAWGSLVQVIGTLI